MPVLAAVAAALIIAWLIWALLENGPTVAGIIITALIVWALIDYA